MRAILVLFVSERLDIETCQQDFYDPSHRTSVAMTAIGLVLLRALAPVPDGASAGPRKSLEDAIQDFQAILTDDQRQKLSSIGAIQDPDTAMIFTAQLDRDNQLKKGRGIACRLSSVLQSVQTFSTVVDTFVSSHPQIAALVWGSIKLAMLIAVNYTSYFEALSVLFMELSKQCPRFAEYQALYMTSTRLQKALCDFHASIIRCCKHVVETFGLLPTNHFGGRKQRSADQALLLLQEHIYKAWRNRKVLSLISFDVKGAYNGVFKDRLLQRLEARGIPKGLVKWIDAFCSNRSATIVVNGYTSGRRDLPQAGLPQGSPLSPVLFLFFNADLVQCKIDAKGGSIAFIDDYSAWVTGPTAEANRVGIQAVIDRALEWERRSGATFEEDKTVIIHFTRHHERTDESPYTIKGQAIIPKKSGKILGLVMDSELRYEEHVKEAATRGLRAAMCLRRLKMLTPRTARQLFVATVAPTMDYASNVWSHRRGWRETRWLNEAQKMGAQAITGAFKTVSMAVAEAEAGILPIGERHAQAGTRLYVNMQTLPKTHPLATLRVRETRRYLSPLTKLALAHDGVIARMEMIEPYALPPWHRHMVVKYDSDKEAAADVDTGDNVTETSSMRQVLIATSASARNGLVGMGGVVRNTAGGGVNDDVIAKYSVTLGLRDEQNAYMAELEAIAMVLRCMPDGLRHREVIIATRNRSALQAIAKPRQQSGQGTIREIYKHVERLEKGGNTIEMRWVSSTDESFTLGAKAKAEARKATDSGCRVTNPPKQARSARLRVLLTQRRQRMMLPEGVGGYSKRLDKALPGKHTRTLYDALKRRESDILVQLRTGMARVNRYLHRIGAAETDTCDCGQEEETVEHFLFRCPRWDEQREHMRNVDREMIGNLSFFLGGKTAEDGHRWSPNLGAVRAVIKFAISTGRLDATQT
ncbi:hypothetical protein HZS61_011546 [Fusarium oxysporum f. sp. conglutinans]|uniref:Reverse transcriptase domain-containing protein n=1 Tax=Fusarium oxysporum f. sp. conglutinans TaxID=100902 RepID=A0A8H6LP51_FUSOX|nr:hypothetical protein HZS61_011546 [Fusarium oxysporum f. sp. conglutinans]KAG6996233.1 putative RNA-directed DNA polymerase from transposon BS [Fusarium oxysporum f. sp. conglutinans]KAI8411031.1 hypothetical protein FOFC_07625 [Fusarium oxysporum]